MIYMHFSKFIAVKCHFKEGISHASFRISHAAYYACLCFKRLICRRQYSRSLYVRSVDKISLTTDIIVFSCLHPYYSTLVNRTVYSSR